MSNRKTKKNNNNNKKIPVFNLMLDHYSQVGKVYKWIENHIKKGYSYLIIEVNPTKRGTNANVCAPLACLLDRYREKGIRIHIEHTSNDYVRHTRFWNPLSVESCSNSDIDYPFDKVWTFETGEGVCKLVSAFVLELRKSDIVEAGVISSIEWCLNEVMDNVLQHSGTSKGYVMAQIYNQTKAFTFCVFDSGMGLYNSLKDSRYHPEQPIDAITLALQEKVTRDDRIGQGNGLWGLSSIVSESMGVMTISSGGAVYRCYKSETVTKKEGGFIIDKRNGTACVDVSINYDKKIDITHALGGHTPIDFWLENIENESGNAYIIQVSEMYGGTGTRQSAIKLRNMAMNIVIDKKKIVILDFSGVNLISSSFADELIGKIIIEKGIYFFMSAFRIANLSTSNAAILNRSVEQRMAQKYYSDCFDDEFVDEHNASKKEAYNLF